MKIKTKLIGILAGSTCLGSCAGFFATAYDLTNEEQAFYQQLASLCGRQFVGETVYPKDPEHSFANKRLVATIEGCSANALSIPFQVGSDQSRTWIISKTEQGLRLRHDHRHPDGTPDEVTLYGGYSAPYKGLQATQYRQFFHADDYTAKLLPEAKTNVWMLEYDPDTQQLTYYLERHQQPRYKAVLSLVSENH